MPSSSTRASIALICSVVATRTDLPRSLFPPSPRQDPATSWRQEATAPAPMRERSPRSLFSLSIRHSVCDLFGNILVEADEIPERNRKHCILRSGKRIDSQRILKACHEDRKAERIQAGV